MKNITKKTLITLGLGLLATTAFSADFDVSGLEEVAKTGYETATKILAFMLSPIIAFAGYSFFKRQIDWTTLRNIVIGCAIILLAPKISETIMSAFS